MAALELKFATSPQHVEALRLALEGAGGDAAPAPSHVASTYYDSPDLKLRQHHLSLAIEELDARRVQALKAGGDAAPAEWRDAIAGDLPDPTAPETGPRLRAAGIDGALRPVFRSELRRTLFTLTPEPSLEIAAALEEGEIRASAGDAAHEVCELELGLKRGEPGAFYDVALKLLDAAPLRIATQSELDRGYGLAGAAQTAVRAKALTLDPAMTVEAVLQSVGRQCLGHLLRNEGAALAGEPEGFHQMRVALRRLRSTLSAVKAMLPPPQYRWAIDELKWLADSLGPARNWDAFALSLLAPVRAALPDDAELRALADAAKRRRRAAYDAAGEAIRSRRYAEMILKLARWFEARGWRDQPASEQSAPLFAVIANSAPLLLEKRWRQALKSGRHFSKLNQEERHELRIALKKLRYMIDFLGGLYPAAEVKTLTRSLKPLQEKLGHLNDVCTAQALMKELHPAAVARASELGRDAGLVLGWHLRGLADEEKRLRRDMRRLRRVEPFWHPLAPAPITTPV